MNYFRSAERMRRPEDGVVSPEICGGSRKEKKEVSLAGEEQTVVLLIIVKLRERERERENKHDQNKTTITNTDVTIRHGRRDLRVHTQEGLHAGTLIHAVASSPEVLEFHDRRLSWTGTHEGEGENDEERKGDRKNKREEEG